MIRGLFILLMLVSTLSWGQIREQKLTLIPKQIYELKGTDILVVDTLIMQDSSMIVLNKLKPDNFIHAKVAIFYNGSTIDGKGMPGIKGRTGRSGTTVLRPCTDGATGLPGSAGTDGGTGTNLFLYLTDFTVNGSLHIDVAGGDAGDGGKGGTGGNGGPGTRICPGGNGGSGALGSQGGNGGNAGVVTFTSARILELRSMLAGKIVIRNYGGNLGLGGDGGGGGFSGLSPVGNPKMDGKPGRKGLKGKDGVGGKTGAINFQAK